MTTFTPTLEESALAPFPGLTPLIANTPPEAAGPSEAADSPCGRWRVTRHCDAHSAWSVLWRRAGDGWGATPAAASSPAELGLLCAGAAKAHGSVVVAGLGLGCLAAALAQNRSVTELILVELEADLAGWLVPHVEARMGRPFDDVVIDDAFKALPRMEADMALIDIYGWHSKKNAFDVQCPGIGELWVWGQEAPSWNA